MAVVFLHGWLMGPSLWDSQAAALDGLATTHAPGGTGTRDAGAARGFDMADWADLVLDELDRRSVEQAVFVGHSMSGYLTQQIWRDHPDRVLGIGLVATTQRPAPVGEQQEFADLVARIAQDWRAQAPTVADLLVGRRFLAANPGWLDAWTEQVERDDDLVGMARVVAAINGRPDYTATTSRIDVPATVVHGTDDRVFPLDRGYGHDLAALIPGADLVEVPGAGHAVPVERPAPVAAAIRGLVERARAQLE
jgi:pimeloyl-ACP methyl ester carboxylesterase